MSRLTRDQQFKKSFEDYMTSFCDLYYPDTENWLLMSDTLNKNKSKQEYKLEIPKKKILYSIDSFVDSNGVRQPKEDVEVDQEVPDKEEFENYFNGYYGGYILRSEKKVLSYVFIVEISKEEDLSLKATILICYYKSYLPYPSIDQTLEQLKVQNKNLVNQISYLNESLNDCQLALEYRREADTRIRIKLKRERTLFNNKLYETIHKMQLKIRGFYSKEDNKEDCPVCYEKINDQELMVPGCCHYICQDCYKKCENCPICRENYIIPVNI